MSLARVALVVAALAAGACVKVPDDLTPIQCFDNADCNTGEECRMNLCFGNPPNLDFAAVVVPPETQPQLPRTEIEHLAISSDGRAQIGFEKGVDVSGRVLIHAGDPASIAAKVTFHRASRIPGAPDWEVTVLAEPGKLSGQAAFHARLSPNLEGEVYTVTIVPSDQSVSGTPAPASLAPPVKITLATLTDNLVVDLTLSDAAGLKAVTSQVLDAAARGMKGMIVRAWGRRTLTAPLELCSSTAVTDDTGKFVLYLPMSWDDTIDIVAAPGPAIYAPSLRRTALYLRDPALVTDLTTFEPLRYPSYPRPVRAALPVFGQDSAGGKTPAVGAAVSFTTTLAGAAVGDVVTYTAQATVASSGLAEAQLIPGDLSGNRTYAVDVIPLANAHHAMAQGQVVMVGPPNPTTGDGGVLAELDLGSRVYVTGHVLDHDMSPADLVTVRPQLSPYFTLPLQQDARTHVTSVPLPEILTDKNGAFGVYLDPVLFGQTAYYDLELVPPASSLQPRWSFDRVSFDTGQLSRDVQDIVLPRASLASSTVSDADGTVVTDAEIDLYVRSTDTSLCGANVPPGGCTPPARLRGLVRSDKRGIVILVLPSP